MFARVLGPFLVIVPATAVARASLLRTLLSEFAPNSLWPWVTGAFILLGGLVVIGLHQYWQSAAAIIVSVVGWLVALKGLFLLAFPQTYISAANSVIGAGALWRAVEICVAVVGLYLTYVGWAPARSQPTSLATSSSTDLPRAA